MILKNYGVVEQQYTRAVGIHPGWLVWNELSEEQREEVLKFELEQPLTRKVIFNNIVYDIPEGMQYLIREYTLPIPFLSIKYEKIFFSCFCGWEFEGPRSENKIECPKCRQIIMVRR